MCSISGCLRMGESWTTEHDSVINNQIKKIMLLGQARGKDSFGYVRFKQPYMTKEVHYVGKPEDILSDPTLDVISDTYLLMNNNRAEPTTEFVNDKKETDVQPFRSDNVWIVHNGTIANDKELIQKYDLNLDTRIDSAVIPWVLEQSLDWTTETLLPLLQDELIGSYALAAYNTKLDKFLLAANYKPLSLLYNKKQDVLYFSSLENYLVEDDYNRIFGDETLIDVKPYTLLLIDRKTKKIEQVSLYKKKEEKQKALICASAGMDSTVAATWAKEQGYEITLLHFEYQCRASKKEKECIQKIAEFLDAELVTIKTDFFKDVLGSSKLYGEEKVSQNEKGAELAIEWVPARNLIFLSIAAGYAEAKDIDKIILGGNLEESGAFSDNELIFQKKFGELLPNALNLGCKVDVLTPVADLMKHDIVKLGLELKAPLHLTWSCYENGDLPCGVCAPCFMRRTAFKMNNQPEVIEYAN